MKCILPPPQTKLEQSPSSNPRNSITNVVDHLPDYTETYPRMTGRRVPPRI